MFNLNIFISLNKTIPHHYCAEVTQSSKAVLPISHNHCLALRHHAYGVMNNIVMFLKIFLMYTMNNNVNCHVSNIISHVHQQ